MKYICFQHFTSTLFTELHTGICNLFLALSVCLSLSLSLSHTEREREREKLMNIQTKSAYLLSYNGGKKVVATLLPFSLQTSEGIGSPDVSSCLCKNKFIYLSIK